MPTSHFLQINEIIQLITLTNPNRLLDIGVGFGKYGFLSREYLELWDGRRKYDDWKRRIDGIEAFKQYLTPVHDFIYDKIFIGNAVDILPTMAEEYDLILLVDVLEHFDYSNGLKLLQECKTHGRNILISVPKRVMSQGCAFGNPCETHRFQWEKSHFLKFKNKFFLPNVHDSLIIYIGEDARAISQKIKKRRFRQTILLFRKTIVRMLEFIHLKNHMRRLLNR